MIKQIRILAFLFGAILLAAPILHADVGTWSGKFSVIAIDNEDGTHATAYWLETPAGAFELKFSNPTLIENLVPNSLVRTHGELIARVIHVSAIEVLEVFKSQDMGGDLGAPRTVLVCLVNFQDGLGQPYTIAQAEDVVLNKMAAWYQEVSYGKVTFSGEAAGWFTMAISSTTKDYYEIRSAAATVAKANGFDPAQYNHFMMVFPKAKNFGWSGLANVGGSNIWINQAMSPFVVTHEMGHNLGLGHANGLKCNTTPPVTIQVPLETYCNSVEYADVYDSMGGSAARYFSAQFLEQLNWIRPDEILNVTQNGVYEINPIEKSASTVKALRISSLIDGLDYQNKPIKKNINYYVEYRQKIGLADSSISDPSVLNGVLVRIHDDNSLSGGTILLDMNPVDGGFNNAGLQVGSTYTDPTSRLKIIPESNDANGIRVRVEFDPTTTSGVVQLEKPQFDVSEDEAYATIRVSRSVGSVGAVSVDYATSGDWSAKIGTDYNPVSGKFTWADGEMGYKTVTIPIVDDSTPESKEYFYIGLSNLTGGAYLGSSNSLVYIYDDDFGVSVDAGTDQTISIGETLNLQAKLMGNYDNGFNLAQTWEMLNGPVDVVFSHPTALATTVQLPEIGRYELRIKVDLIENGAVTSSTADKLIVKVISPLMGSGGTGKNAFYPNRGESARIPIASTPNSSARVTIYDRQGHEVLVLPGGAINVSDGVALWDGKNSKGEMVTSGIYLAVIESGASSRKLKLAVLK